MDDQEQRDRELLQAWAEGDKRAGGRLIKRHFDALNRFFANKVSDSERADLIQSTLLHCTQAIERFRGDARFRTYLLSIARNVLLHHYRTRGRKLDHLDPLTHSVAGVSTAGLFTKLVGARQHEAIVVALRQLPIDLQIVLELKYWERLTAKECGIVLELSPNTISSRIQRAKALLTRMLDESGGRREVGSAESGGVDAWMEDVRGILGGDPRELIEEHEDEHG